ncbi:hypothetical protein [Propionibacterium sp.]|uniref:hypothetical protein n=1 Tax=Propionibacterium sp. TaxID=1977903 RepID=UPI0039EA316E
MTVFIVVLIVCLVLAVGVGAVVGIGMAGYYRGRNPKLANRLNRVGRRLNGEPPANSKLEDIVSRD